MKKKRYMERVRVESPCIQDWNEMTGDDKVRFCGHCAKDVNNLSAMTRKDALQLVRESNGQLCIRYIKHPETNAPMFSEQLVQISRRVPRVAAGVMSASLSLSTFAYAQGNSYLRAERPATPVTQRAESKPLVQKNEVASPAKSEAIPPPQGPIDSDSSVKVSSEAGKISGTVVDPQAAVVPGVTIALRDLEGNEIVKTTTGDDGTYSIDQVPFGSYMLVASGARGFRPATVPVSIRDASERIENLSLGILYAVAGAVAVAIERPEYKGAVMSAIANDDLNRLRDLIVAGEDVNQKEVDNRTPLFLAVERGEIAIVRLLLEFGAKINARNEERQTPLMMLSDEASIQLVELLIHHGAKVNVTADNGDTPLIRAARETKPEVLNTLITAGAELNAQNEEGVTALMNAADSDNLENVRALLLAGADVNLRDEEGDNAWDFTSDSDIESLLVSHGVILDSEDVEDSRDEPINGPDDEESDDDSEPKQAFILDGDNDKSDTNRP